MYGRIAALDLRFLRRSTGDGFMRCAPSVIPHTNAGDGHCRLACAQEKYSTPTGRGRTGAAHYSRTQRASETPCENESCDALPRPSNS